ncbi:hypothetical protein KIPB_005460 [Kipferlia bialata]|uniref:Replication factor Mcm10 C-terminal domain-containing protein n=1 Tax=Kipferlia bialata TaxID=797122 RepID=A0A9K3CWQ0_9EUKA|nr:hypothetical protein KIPB_005460 [Kipferlia bialata]|eukprot:g5460.t1
MGDREPEKFTKLLVSNWAWESDSFYQVLEGKKFVKVRNVLRIAEDHRRENPTISNCSLGEDSFLIVVVTKNSGRVQTRGGKGEYHKLEISDLRTTELTLHMFKGACESELTGATPGCLVALANPTLFLASSSPVRVLVSVSDPDQIIMIGDCVNYGTCGHSRRGQKCQNPIDRLAGAYCIHHMAAKVKQSARSRYNERPTAFQSTSMDQASQGATFSVGITPVPNRFGGFTRADATKGVANTLGNTLGARGVAGEGPLARQERARLASQERARQIYREVKILSARFNQTKDGRLRTATNKYSKKMVSEANRDYYTVSATDPTPVSTAVKAKPRGLVDIDIRRKAGQGSLGAKMAAAAVMGQTDNAVPMAATGYGRGDSMRLVVGSTAANESLSALAQAVQQRRDRAARPLPSGTGSGSPPPSKGTKGRVARPSRHSILKARASSPTANKGAASNIEGAAATSGTSKASSSASAREAIRKRREETKKERERERERKKKEKSDRQGLTGIDRLAAQYDTTAAKGAQAAMDALQDRETDKAVKGWSCGTCHKTFKDRPSNCIEQGHQVQQTKAVERWFECQKCKYRMSLLNTMRTTEECPRCCSTEWKRTGMASALVDPVTGRQTDG